MPRIRLDRVSKSFGKVRAIDDMSLEIEDGEYLCLLGPTGAGKTTTLKVISGLLRLDDGRVMFDGRDVTDLEPEDRRAAMLFQTYSLFPHMTVAENILFGPDIRDWDERVKKETLTSMLDMVRLTRRSDAFPRELSGGMQQRTALARALASGAKVLLLDEPLRALDARLRIDLRRELKSLVKSLNITTLHVTHDQDEALVMADRIGVIREGRIVQIGRPEELYERPASPFVANFLGQSNFIPGKVVNGGERTVIRCEAGEAPAGATLFPAGAEVILSVKTGHTQISIDEGYLEGTIERILFEGKVSHIDVHVEGLGRFSSKHPLWRREKLRTGQKVYLRWEPERANVFPYPERGLEEELRVE